MGEMSRFCVPVFMRILVVVFAIVDVVDFFCCFCCCCVVVFRAVEWTDHCELSDVKYFEDMFSQYPINEFSNHPPSGSGYPVVKTYLIQVLPSSYPSFSADQRF